jgi:hypothetical protein
MRPGPRELLRRIILCGLIKHSVAAAARAGEMFPASKARSSREFKKKRERFDQGRRARIDVLLDQKFEAWGRHNNLLNTLAEKLRAHGYRLEEPDRFDLLARKAQQAVIIEVKAWNRRNLVGTLRAAVGQLLYYAHVFDRGGTRTAKLVAAIPFRPTSELLRFVEGTAKIGLLWSSGHRFEGGRLARQIFPNLLSS